MRTTVRKWGNSLALRIPSGLAEDARLADGAEVEVVVRDGQLVVVPVVALSELVARITPDNLPDLEWDDAAYGSRRGGEVW